MKKIVGVLSTTLLALSLTGCPHQQPTEQSVRDALAASYGAIHAAYVEYQPECSANPAQSECKAIIKAATAFNTARTVAEAYCQFGPDTPNDAVCKPVKSYEAALVTSLQNLQSVTSEVTALIGKGKQK